VTGTVFRLAFPVRRAIGMPQTRTACDDETGSFRVLVVDDEKEVLAVLGELLEALGQTVTTRQGGVEGLAELRELSAPGTDPKAMPEIVFTDLGMPGVSGWDIARETKALFPDAFVVLVTGWGVQIETESARGRGVDYLLGKPFTVEDVEGALRKIRGVVNARSGQRAA